MWPYNIRNGTVRDIWDFWHLYKTFRECYTRSPQRHLLRGKVSTVLTPPLLQGRCSSVQCGGQSPVACDLFWGPFTVVSPMPLSKSRALTSSSCRGCPSTEPGHFAPLPLPAFTGTLGFWPLAWCYGSLHLFASFATYLYLIHLHHIFQLLNSQELWWLKQQ